MACELRTSVHLGAGVRTSETAHLGARMDGRTKSRSITGHTPAQFPGAIAFEAYTLRAALAREPNKVRIGALVSGRFG